jgi:RNA-binding protein
VPLNGKQKSKLRALGHHLHPVVQVGSSGATPGVVAAVGQALEDHELVKVKLALEREERQAALAVLVEGTGAEVAQVLGKTALLFRKRAKKSKFEKLGVPARAPGEAPPPADDDPLP